MSNNGKPLTRADIDAADDQILQTHYVEGWRGQVTLRGLNGDGLFEFERVIGLTKGDNAKENEEDGRLKLIARCLTDPSGNRLYTDSPADLAALGKKSGKVLQQLYGACMDINGYTKKDMEELTAPNPFARTSDSGSGSA